MEWCWESTRKQQNGFKIDSRREVYCKVMLVPFVLTRHTTCIIWSNSVRWSLLRCDALTHLRGNNNIQLILIIFEIVHLHVLPISKRALTISVYLMTPQKANLELITSWSRDSFMPFSTLQYYAKFVSNDWMSSDVWFNVKVIVRFFQCSSTQTYHFFNNYKWKQITS